MKWTVRAEAKNGEIRAVEVEADNTDGIVPALRQKRLPLKRILSVEPHGVIPLERWTA